MKRNSHSETRPPITWLAEVDDHHLRNVLILWSQFGWKFSSSLYWNWFFDKFRIIFDQFYFNSFCEYIFEWMIKTVRGRTFFFLITIKIESEHILKERKHLLLAIKLYTKINVNWIIIIHIIFLASIEIISEIRSKKLILQSFKYRWHSWSFPSYSAS